MHENNFISDAVIFNTQTTVFEKVKSQDFLEVYSVCNACVKISDNRIHALVQTRFGNPLVVSYQKDAIKQF